MAVMALLFFSVLYVLTTFTDANLRGVPPEDLSYFNSKLIRCRDGSKTIPIEKINDDFCDCSDGTDEPGTSACPTGRFYCVNKGHIPSFVFSSRVNDGICDCCDGSDEHNGQVVCKNRCKEEGAASRKLLAEDAARASQGAQIRSKLVEESRKQRNQWTEELDVLRAEKETLKAREAILREQKVAIEKVEREQEEEKRRLEKIEEEQRAAEAATLIESPVEEAEKVAEETNPPEVEENEIHDHEAESAEGFDGGSPDDSDATPSEDSADKLTDNFDATSAEDSDATSEDDSFTTKADDLDAPTEDDVSAADSADDSDALLAAETDATSTDSSDAVASHDNESPETSEANDESFEGLSKEEIGRRIASRWTGGGGAAEDAGGELEEKNIPNSDAVDDVVDDSAEEYSQQQEEEPEEHFNHDDDEGQDSYSHDDDDVEDVPESDDAEQSDENLSEDPPKQLEDPPSPSHSSEKHHSQPWLTEKLETLKKSVSSLFSWKSKQSTPVDPSESEKVKRDYEKVSSDVKKIESKISKLEKKLRLDFGRDGEFLSFEGNCFKLTVNQYEYEVCPYKQAVQHEGHINTRLGNWEGFSDNYSKMVFGKGERCWNGPERSLTVSLRCGLNNQLSSVNEPSRCEYTAILTTPVVCSVADAEELEKRLEKKLKELEDVHDEL